MSAQASGTDRAGASTRARGTEVLAGWAAGLQWDDIPMDVRHAAVTHFVDAYGVALAASATPFGQQLLASLATADEGSASVIGSDRRVDALRAAIINGTLVHGLEYDDTHIASIVHGSGVALAAAMSQAHLPGVTAADVLTGFVIAWETMIRLGLLAPGGYQSRGFQTAAVTGAPAAALAVGRLRRLDAPMLSEAVAVATSFSSGLMAYAADGATVKRAHLGWAAHGGIAAVDLATSGITGPTRPLTSRFGFLHVLAGRDDHDPAHDRAASAAILDDVGTRWHLNDAAYKLYPVCHYIHSYLDVVDELRSLHPLDTIGAIECTVHPAVTNVISDDPDRRRRPGTFEQAQYSLHFSVAHMFTHGDCDIDTMAANIRDPEVLSVADRVVAVVDPDLEFPGVFPAHVRLRDHDGEVLVERSIVGPRGATLSGEELAPELREKFVRNASRRMSPDEASALFERMTASGSALTMPAMSWLT
jgi:2-methylcitrate dehydratase PrpD